MTRRLYFHGFLIILISFALGLVVASSGPGPRGRLWLGAHTTGISTGLLLVAAGAVWSGLRLGPRAQKVAYFCLWSGSWAGLIFLGIFGSIMAIPAQQAAPGLPPVAGWPMAVFGVAIAFVTVTLLVGAVLMVVGLRPGASDAA